MKTIPPLASRLLLVSMLFISAGVYAAALFTPNNQPTGWLGEVEVSDFNFGSGLETIYRGDFTRADWSGNLFAFPVDSQGSILFAAERWTTGGTGGVADNLNAQNYNTGRIIVTLKKDGTKIPFRWASLDSNQQSGTGGNSKIIDYIRGDRVNEDPLGAKYRARSKTTVLGDIIHSRPLYVAHPTEPRVYVGANDGMLHAFDADSGSEVFAYVPSFFTLNSANFSNVGDLTTKPYVHQYYVDASPNARTVTISGVDKTILVGGVGAGGKGLYALDITDPTASTESAAASKILWEITPTTINNVSNTAYADLGNTYGIPLIVKLSDGTSAAIVGNGYNNQGSNQAVLYVINLLTGAKIAGITASVSGTSNSSPNGLSSPTALDTDHDGKVDYVYAGDINGNLWKFDIRNISSPVVTKLFTTSPAQPITGRPAVSLHPNGGYLVNFATGRMFTSADATDAATVYYAFGLWDNGTTIDPTKIVSQTLTTKTWTSGSFNYNVRVSSSNAVDYTAATPKQGWKLALPAGERVVGDGGLVTNMRYIFSSTNPTVAHAAVGGVAQPQGDNWLNEIDFTTGGGGSSPIFDLDANLTLDNADRVRDSGGTLAQTGPTGIPISRYIGAGVLSQPIVARLNTLSETYFNTNPDLAVAVGSSAGPGVSNGHFDFDIYYATCTVSASSYRCPSNTHVHEYDDKYDVTGVNMLAPSLSAFNVKNPIPSPATKYKVLMANQKFSPAVQFIVGKNPPGDPVTIWGTAAGMTMASLTAYSTSTIKNLEFALPLDAFKSKDWTGTGDIRAGLVPTATGCVHANKGGTTGPWMNGALTIQLVKELTPDSAVQLNVAGDPLMGYRLKNDATSQGYQLAQYTMFWHHPNGKCYGDVGWVKNPPEDLSGTPGASATAAPGAADPKDGAFGGSGGAVGSGGGLGGRKRLTGRARIEEGDRINPALWRIGDRNARNGRHSASS